LLLLPPRRAPTFSHGVNCPFEVGDGMKNPRRKLGTVYCWPCTLLDKQAPLADDTRKQQPLTEKRCSTCAAVLYQCCTDCGSISPFASAVVTRNRSSAWRRIAGTNRGPRLVALRRSRECRAARCSIGSRYKLYLPVLRRLKLTAAAPGGFRLREQHREPEIDE
jgi:hypothetical protein